MPLPAPLQDALHLFGGSHIRTETLGHLESYAHFVRTELEPVAYEVDRRNRPYLQAHNLLGSDIDTVVLGEDHRRMLRTMYRSGIATGPVEGKHPWWHTFALGYLTTDVGFFCSATVTMATVFSVAKYAADPIRSQFLPLLLEEGAVRQGATWATEAQGGSDLGANITRATPGSGGRFHLSGEKYFCSNVGAEFAVVTARTPEAPRGARGIRLFLVPARRGDGTPNWRIRRLKEKLGTTCVPTGEVSLLESEAYPLGEASAGIHPTMEMLNLSRICNSIGSAAAIDRASEMAMIHARDRKAFGQRLIDHPLMGQDLARLAAFAEAATLLAFDAAFAYDGVWKEQPPYSPDYYLLRFSTHAAKMLTAEQAVRECPLAMEILGGPGYLEEYPMSKHVRDALVTPVWEGGANVQALDALEACARSHPEDTWRKDAEWAHNHSTSEAVRRAIERRLQWLKAEPSDAFRSAKPRLRNWGELRELTLMTRLCAHTKEKGGTGLVRVQALTDILALLIDNAAPEGLATALVQDALSTG
jgi:acyl-CoA dehydrogenase